MSRGLDKAGEINRSYTLCNAVGQLRCLIFTLKNNGKPLKGSSKSGVTQPDQKRSPPRGMKNGLNVVPGDMLMPV